MGTSARMNVVAKVWKDMDGYDVVQSIDPDLLAAVTSTSLRNFLSGPRIQGRSGKMVEVEIPIDGRLSPTWREAIQLIDNLKGMATFMTKYGPLSPTKQPLGRRHKNSNFNVEPGIFSGFIQVTDRYWPGERRWRAKLTQNLVHMAVYADKPNGNLFLSQYHGNIATNANITIVNSDDGPHYKVELASLWDLLVWQRWGEFEGSTSARTPIIRNCGYCGVTMQVGGRRKGSLRKDAIYCCNSCRANAYNLRKTDKSDLEHHSD